MSSENFKLTNFSSYPSYESTHDYSINSESAAAIENVKIAIVAGQILDGVKPEVAKWRTITVRSLQAAWALTALVVGSWYAAKVILEPPGEDTGINEHAELRNKLYLPGALGFGIFPAHHALELVSEWAKPRTIEEQELRSRHCSWIQRSAKGGIVFLWALGTHLGTPFVIHTSNPKFGAEAIAIDSLITVLSCLAPSLRSANKLTEQAYEALYYAWKRFSKDNKVSEILQIQKRILELIDKSIDHGMPMTMEERIQKFDKMYENALVDRMTPVVGEIGRNLIQIEACLKQLLMPPSEEFAYSIQTPKWYEISSNALGYSTAITAVIVYDFLISGCLAKGSASLVTDNEGLQYFLAGLAVLCWLYLTAVAPAKGYQTIYGQIADAGGIQRNRRKTFAEQYYPKAVKILTLLGFTIAAWGIPEMRRVAKNCFNEETARGQTLIALECYSLMGFFINSVCSLANHAIEQFAASSYSSEEKRHAIDFVNKCRGIQEIFNNTSPPDLQEWLESLQDEELKANLLKNATSFTSVE